MENIVCKKCGSSEFIDSNNARICLYCRAKYDKPAIPKKVNATIALSNDVQVLLDKCKKDPANARRYANLVLDIDPINAEAKKILGY